MRALAKNSGTQHPCLQQRGSALGCGCFKKIDSRYFTSQILTRSNLLCLDYGRLQTKAKAVKQDGTLIFLENGTQALALLSVRLPDFLTVRVNRRRLAGIYMLVGGLGLLVFFGTQLLTSRLFFLFLKKKKKMFIRRTICKCL